MVYIRKGPHPAAGHGNEEVIAFVQRGGPTGNASFLRIRMEEIGAHMVPTRVARTQVCMCVHVNDVEWPGKLSSPDLLPPEVEDLIVSLDSIPLKLPRGREAASGLQKCGNPLA